MFTSCCYYLQLITGDVRGLFAYGFCDFGPSFEVFDSNGEEAKDVFVCNITKVCACVHLSV